MSEPSLTRRQVAERLNVSLFTVDRLIKTGQLPSLKIGKSRRIPASGLDVFVERASRPEGVPTHAA